MFARDMTIRECVSTEDFKQCIDLERSVWKDDDIDVMPIRLYMISKACNAPTIGAFDASGKLTGFVHTMLALKDGRAIFHSHMAAVDERLRHRDIGYRLKLAQRERALEAGIPLIIWTFDPLQSRNAHLNINKLGAVVRRYAPNYYGEGVSTMFDSGVPSDRIFAEWWVASPHVTTILEGQRNSVQHGMGEVQIPDDIDRIRAGSLEELLRWRLKVRKDFEQALAGGGIARGFVRDAATGRSRYIFGPDEPQFHFDQRVLDSVAPQPTVA
jgi:predicted GNAT superfamily acetyltransferase